MKFPKDILILDFETTDLDPYKALPIQIGLILLDKETFIEKDSYLSFIKSDTTSATKEALAVSGITTSQLLEAPSPEKVGREIFQKFGTNVFLSSWGQRLDRIMLDKLLGAAGIDTFSFDYHYLDIWPLAYVHLLKQDYKGGFRSEEIFQAFGLDPRGKHDALDDCRREAEIFRKIMQA
jgi:DNA polymerase III epsilon subunit-like protein